MSDSTDLDFNWKRLGAMGATASGVHFSVNSIRCFIKAQPPTATLLVTSACVSLVGVSIGAMSEAFKKLRRRNDLFNDGFGGFLSGYLLGGFLSGATVAVPTGVAGACVGFAYNAAEQWMSNRTPGVPISSTISNDRVTLVISRPEDSFDTLAAVNKQTKQTEDGFFRWLPDWFPIRPISGDQYSKAKAQAEARYEQFYKGSEEHQDEVKKQHVQT